MALVQYQQDVQRYLHDPNATYFSLTDLTRYINLARRYVAIKSQSVRALLSGGSIISVSIVSGGTGYAGPPTFSFAPQTIATIGGTVHTGDVCSIVTTSSSITGSPITISRTVLSADTLVSVASALAASYNANANLTAAGLVAVAAGPVVNIYQTLPLAVTPVFTSSVTGTNATTTVTISSGTTGSQAIITGTVSGGAVNSVTIVSGGWGFFTTPYLLAGGNSTAGTDATFSVTVDNSCSTVPGQEVYQFSTFNALAQTFPGIQSVCGIFSVACSQGGTYKPILTPCTWTEFQAYLRIYQNQAQNYPVYWSQYGQGISGSFYLFPWPSQVLQMDIDAWCIPVDLTSDSTPEAIPLPFSDAVPYFAAYLALVDAQRMADANEMKARADVYLQFSRAGVDAPFVPEYYGAG